MMGKPASAANTFLKLRRVASFRKNRKNKDESSQRNFQESKGSLRKRFSFRKNKKTHVLLSPSEEEEKSAEILTAGPLETPKGDVNEGMEQEDGIEEKGKKKGSIMETKLSSIEEEVGEENSQQACLGFINWFICRCI